MLATPRLRSVLRLLPTILAIVFVLTAYVFFGSNGKWEFRRVHWYTVPYDAPGAGYYASLTEGFRRGQLSMAHTPDPRLVALKDPYDAFQRELVGTHYLWDASLYRGKYYLYFSPLPSFLFYWPYRIVGRDYPQDFLAAVFFSAWTFVMAAAFARRALAGRKLFVPLPLWVLLIGFGNVIVFLLPHIRTYEVAILCGSAMTATWAYSLLRFLETGARKQAFWMGVWLALSICARPNLGVLLLVAAIAILALRDRRLILRAATAALIPLSIVGLLMIAYNLRRFGHPLEFGIKYQLTFVDMAKFRVCGLCSLPEAVRIVNSSVQYVFWGPSVGSEFPFIDIQRSRLDPKVAFPAGAEQIVGIGALVPLTLLGTFFALILFRSKETAVRAALLVMAAAWLALFGLAACWWVTARYAMDFMVLMTIAAAICVEAGLTFLASAGVSFRPLRVLAIVLALYSIAIGFFAGFNGTDWAFSRNNPELFKKLHDRLGTQPKLEK